MKDQNKLINFISIAIVVAVALILGIKQKVDMGDWTKQIPYYNALINSTTALFLMFGYFAIANKKVTLHRFCMLISMLLGSLFLVLYVLYHISNPSTAYGGKGFMMYFYYFILISHIVLSLVVLPLVLRAFYFAISNQIIKHKKIAKFALPIWLYVSISGVLAYFLISPYY